MKLCSATHFKTILDASCGRRVYFVFGEETKNKSSRENPNRRGLKNGQRNNGDEESSIPSSPISETNHSKPIDSIIFISFSSRFILFRISDDSIPIPCCDTCEESAEIVAATSHGSNKPNCWSSAWA